MKKKSNLKVLLPVVVIIWGLVLYQLLAAFGGDSEPLAINEQTSRIPVKKVERDTFSLLLVDQDPFLGTLKNRQTPKTKKALAKNTQKINWPPIEYLGLVSGGSSSSRIYIININGQQQLLKRNDTAMGIKVTGGNEQYVRLRWKGTTKKIEKS